MVLHVELTVTLFWILSLSVIESTSAWRLAPGVVARRELEMAASVKVIGKNPLTSVDLKARVFQRAIAVHSPRPAVRHAVPFALAPLAQRFSERNIEMLMAAMMPSAKKSGQAKDTVANFEARAAESISAAEQEVKMVK